MFGRRRRDLEDAIEVARSLLASDRIDEMTRASALARELAFGLTGPELDVIDHLEDRIEHLLQARVAQALRACANCAGRVYRISKPRELDGLGRGRIVICGGCGLVRSYVERVEQLPADQFGPPVDAPDVPGPYR